MRLTVLGGCGAWPEAGQACSGFLVEHDGFRLLRARVLGGGAARLPVYAPPGALDAVLALDRPGMLDAGYALHPVQPGDALEIGPFRAWTRLLPHTLPNAGVRL